MDKILKARPIDGCRIEILTSSGVSGIFNVKPYLHGSAFKALLAESYFRLAGQAKSKIPTGVNISATSAHW